MEARRNGGTGLPLVRGAESNLRSVGSIVENIPDWVLQLSPMPRVGEGITERWLRSGLRNKPTNEEEEYISCIRGDIPLLLYILLEAAETEWPALGGRRGEYLGAIGSFIIAEFLFKEYWRTHPLIEADKGAEDLSTEIFGGAPPNSMPKLIAQIARVRDSRTISPKFW